MRLRRLDGALRFSILGGLLLGLASVIGACSGDDDDASGGHAGTSGIVLVVGSGGSAAGDTATPGEAGEPAMGPDAMGGDAPAVGGTPAGGSATSGGNGLYLPCASQADCKQYGGGKICCSASSMRFCTKQSACAGDILP